MIVNRSAPGGDVVPYLIYNDVARAIDWLCDVFGFTERLRISGGDGKVGHAQLAIGMGGLFLGAPRKGQSPGWQDTAEFRPPRPNEVTQTISVRVEDVDRHHEHARQRGARILNPPTTYPFGERQYTAEDPEGYRWGFTQSVADVKPEDWGATVSEIRSPLALLPRPRLCYLEIPAIDVQQSADFYENVFGWNIRHRESQRPGFDDATTYVSGAFVTGREIARAKGLLPYIWVDGIDAVLKRVTASGGEVLDGTRSEGGAAWIATFRDPAGNLIGLYQEGPR